MSNLIYSSHRLATPYEVRLGKALFRKKAYTLPPTARFVSVQVNNTGDIIEVFWFSKRKKGIIESMPRKPILFNKFISAPTSEEK